jgi:hypothetical protein
MTKNVPSPTIDFPRTAPPESTGVTEDPDALTFYLGQRQDLATELTLAAFLAKLETAVEDEEGFSQSAVKSLPRSWREL